MWFHFGRITHNKRCGICPVCFCVFFLFLISRFKGPVLCCEESLEVNMADVEAFIEAPSQELLGTFSREQLLLIAEHFAVSIVGDRRVKDNIKDSIE